MSQLYETPQEQQHEQEAQEPEQRKKREQHNHQQQEQLRQERQGSVQQENGEQQKKHGHKRQEPSTQPKLKQTSSEQNPEQREQPKQKQASSKQNPEQRKQPKQEQQAASKQDSEQPKSTTIINPHDKYFRKALGDVTVAEDFLKQFLPAKVQKSVEWESLEVQNGSFIDAYLKNSACDILYTAKFAEETAYFYILLEHQSQPHKLMPLRILDYTVQILKQHLNQHPHPEDQSKPLPLVYPLVFYTGKEPYYYSNDICTLIRASDEMINDFFSNHFS